MQTRAFFALFLAVAIGACESDFLDTTRPSAAQEDRSECRNGFISPGWSCSHEGLTCGVEGPGPCYATVTRVVCRGGTFAVFSSTTASEEECRSKGPPDASLLDASDAAADGDAPSDAASDGD